MSENNKQLKKRGHTYRQWAIALLANSMSLSYGIDCGWISPTTKIWQSDESPTGAPLSDLSITWIASTLNLSAVVGTVVFAFVADAYGRKTSIICLTFPAAICWLIRITCTSVPAIIISRVIGGLSAGGTFNVIPMYVKEISQDDIRGALGSLLSVNTYVGIFLVYALGSYLDYYTVMYIVILFPIIAVVLLLKAPESPAYLVQHGKLEDACDTVAFLRGLDKKDKVVQTEVERMKNEDAYFKSLPKVSMISILKNKVWRRGLILIVLGTTITASNGTAPILTYARFVLASSDEDSNISPEVKSLIIPLVMICSSLMSTVLIERWGRKPFLSISYLISTISMASLGIATLTQSIGYAVPSWLPIGCIIVCVSMHSMALITVTYVILAELFSYQIRAKVMGYVVSFAWFMTFVSVYLYTFITNTFGQYTTFFLYAIINGFGGILVSCFFPETKGKSDAEIREILAGNVKPRVDCA